MKLKDLIAPFYVWQRAFEKPYTSLRPVEERPGSPRYRGFHINLIDTCVGCGSCAYTCPTCHCFDIVDESHGMGGCRVRNWDSCQFAGFTLHASGHNPRRDQAARQRQRSTHKFVIYPEKFGDVLCTGCGNCYRNCPVNLGVLNVLRAAAAQPTMVEDPA